MHDDATSKNSTYEMTDASAVGIVIVGITLFGFCAITSIVLYFVLGWSTVDRPAMTDYEKSPLAGEHETWTTDARLQVDLAAELDEYQSSAGSQLDRYGTVSESPEVYHIPIEIAMEIIVHSGKLPTFTPLEAAEDSAEH